jgi:hypothetical protein
MAVAAGSGLQVSGSKRGPVNAFFIGRKKSGRVTDLFLDLGTLQMTLQAERHFLFLVDGKDVVRSVASDTVGRPAVLRDQNAAVCGT